MNEDVQAMPDNEEIAVPDWPSFARGMAVGVGAAHLVIVALDMLGAVSS